MSLPDDFVLPVDKPEGPTSHDVVAMARKALGTRRVGHTGTLDPFASGLLLLCVGRATRIAEYLSGLDKTYAAVARLGVTTDTLDREGDVVAESGGWESLDTSRIGEACAALVGDVLQVPPQFSAKKVGGVAMHRRARAGEEVRLEPVAVHISALEPTSWEPPLLHFDTTCSSGTYVRAIARDLGEALRCGAHLVALRRLAVGRFSVGAAVPAAELHDGDRVGAAAITPLEALEHMPTVAVDIEAVEALAQGRAIPVDDALDEAAIAVAHAGRLVAIGEGREGVLRPRKVFAA